MSERNPSPPSFWEPFSENRQQQHNIYPIQVQFSSCRFHGGNQQSIPFHDTADQGMRTLVNIFLQKSPHCYYIHVIVLQLLLCIFY